MKYLSLEHNYEEIPVKQADRKYTDVVCSILAATFAIALFVFALVSFLANGNMFEIQSAILRLFSISIQNWS